MKKAIIQIFCFIGIFGMLDVQGQGQKVRVLKIEVDSKPVASEFALYLHKDGRRIIPVREGSDFEVPQDLGDSPVSVQVVFEGFDLWFSPVYPSKFTTNWIIGVDKKPFEIENLGRDKSNEVKLIYYLQFVSDVGDDTRLVITERKKKKKRLSAPNASTPTNPSAKK